jgi:uncharacterized protein CbrC (UPF0167 family)
LNSVDDLIVPCPSCGQPTVAEASGKAQRCVSCGQPVSLDDPVTARHGCWRCLRDGRWASTMGTEAGMVRWEDAVRGRTHGMPFFDEPAWIATADGLQRDDQDGPQVLLAGFATVPTEDDGWREVVIPSELLLELIRTPSYSTWQGEAWLFHCGRPMRYIGRWARAQFDDAAEDGDGRMLARQIADLPSIQWDHGLPEDPSTRSNVRVYLFECTACDSRRGHWDMT